MLIGYLYTSILDYNYDKKYIDVIDEVNITGVVVQEPEEKEYKYTYTIKVDNINGNDKYRNTKLIFNLKKSDSLNTVPKFGDKIEVTSVVEKPDEARNYKGFSYKQYLKSKKIYGTIEAKNVKILSNNNMDIISKIINYVQNSLKSNINKY